MKKILTHLLIAKGLFAGVALSPSIPLFPEQGLFIAKESFATLKTGYYLDYIWKMNLSNNHKITKATSASLTQYGALSLCLADLVDLYGFVGGQNNSLNFKKNQTVYRFKETGAFSWALFADGILNQWDKLQLGASAFYTSTPSREGSLYKKGTFLTKTAYQYYAWGLSLGFAYDFPPFAPYARIDFQKSKSSLNFFKRSHFHTAHPLGLSFGFTCDMTNGFFVDFELRMIQTWASRLMLGLRL